MANQEEYEIRIRVYADGPNEAVDKITEMLNCGCNPDHVMRVVEHNGEAVAPSQFAKRQLSRGDRLEIVRIVAGG